MKKLRLLLLVFICHLQPIFSWCPSPCTLLNDTFCNHLWSIEARAGYYHPKSESLRRAFCDGGVEAEGEITCRFFQNYQLFGNVSGFTCKGHSIGTGNRAYIRIFPLSLGVRYIFSCFNCFEPYIGVGAATTIFRSKNFDGDLREKISKQGYGVVFKSGVYFYVTPHIYVDLFADYHWQKLHFRSTPIQENLSVNISGVRAGIGVGYTF